MKGRSDNRDWIERQLAHADSSLIRDVYNLATCVEQQRASPIHFALGAAQVIATERGSIKLLMPARFSARSATGRKRSIARFRADTKTPAFGRICSNCCVVVGIAA